MTPAIRNLLLMLACVLVSVASAAWSAFYPWGWMPPSQVEQPICNDNPQPGCVPLHRLT